MVQSQSGGSTAPAPSKSELQRADAAGLDRRIRLLATSIGDSFSQLYELVEEAKATNVHVTLGFRSWTAYVADACKVEVKVGRDQRRDLVVWLSGEGMSQRAIADVVGISKNTVTSDLDHLSQIGTPDGGSEHHETPAAPVTGTDGKTYIPPAESPTKKHRKPITDDAFTLTCDLRQINSRLNKLIDDDRFIRNCHAIGGRMRPEIANGLEVLPRIDEAINL